MQLFGLLNNDFAGVMKSIGGILLAIVILLAMVTIHEFGHYVAGKILNFKINEFSIGFGPALFKKRSKKTGELFALRVIPLGGYCAFDGEDELYDEQQENPAQPQVQPFEDFENKPPMSELNNEDNASETLSKEDTAEEYPEPKGERFNDQAPWKRIIVLIAGATMNYLLALLLLIIMFAGVGQPLYKVVDYVPQGETVAVPIVSGFEVGDVVEKIEGKDMYMITDYMDVLSGRQAGEQVFVTVFRGGKSQTITITLQADANFVNMSDTNTLLTALGLHAMHSEVVAQDFFTSVGKAAAYSVKIGGVVLRSLGELLTGKMGLESMGGPVTTISVTAEAASSGLLSFLNIAAFIGVNLAVFNLLPIPALDGCKVIFCLIEWIRKKPVNRKIEAIIHLVGIIVLFGFAILVDLLHLF